MDKFNLSTLNGMVGETVSVVDSDNPKEKFEAKVEKIRESPMNGDEWEAFAVMMKVDENECVLKQGNYHLSHEKFGDVELFCSPNDASTMEFVISKKKS
ncbi:MAG: hypothetical protein P8X74_08770 [Reinekea sp.]